MRRRPSSLASLVFHRRGANAALTRVLALAALALIVGCAQPAADAADLVLRNGRVVTLDEAVIADREWRLSQHLGRFLDLLNPLDLFDADIEETDRWSLHAEQGSGHRRAHQGKLDDLAAIGANIRTDIEHDALRRNRRPDSNRPCRLWPAL